MYKEYYQSYELHTQRNLFGSRWKKHHDCDTYKYLYIIDKQFLLILETCALDHIRKWIHHNLIKQEEVGTDLGL